MTEETIELRARFEAARADGLALIDAATDLASLEDAKIRVLGRKAPLARARSGLGSLDEQARREMGRLANEIQTAVDTAIAEKRSVFEAREREARWQREQVDVTLPGEVVEIGTLHPLTRTTWEIVDIFLGLGYRLAEGPEVETTTYNYDALNTPLHHPARSEQDTYYVENRGQDVCLRTETSPVQIRTMEASEPPVYIVAPGRVYRREAEDATHTAQFAQIEGLAVDEGITMGDLKGTLQVLARELFGRDLDIRLRPSHFPFTEPSAEMDVQCFICKGAGCRLCKGEGWIELLGCGMVHPSVLEWVGYDPERYTGFAFGMGIERAAALAHGVPDIRYFYENDLRFLGRFAGLV
ncbi:MAG: phenylalanine--tRNA ligase subunit alpha [Actinomycetota bacterium]|nr:phenylalanine--tRNA ligase subunit alpha [Actinomycetota bacterium]